MTNHALRITPIVGAAAIALLALGTPAARATPAEPSAPQTTRTVQAPYTFGPGRSVSSDTARLVMQTDGNLVVYDEHGRGRWASHTEGTGYRADFQTDGNFVVYTKGTPRRAVWSSGTGGHPGARLRVQDDGNVVIYDGSQAIWNTGTAH